jgi:signal transduction histidine kinase
LDGPHLSAEEIEAVRHIAHGASPILARLQEIESLKRLNQELAEKAERAAIAEANLAKVTDEKIRFEALIKIANHVQSNIAHDLRTPLGAIRGYARMILDGRAGDTNDTQRDYLRIITENTNRVINIANWMSHVADLAGQPIAVRAFDLRELWAESIRAAQGLFSSKALTLTQRIPQESFEIIADREKLAFAFKELLSVVVKLSEAESAITAEFSQGRQREVIVKITAKGSGIWAEALNGIFDHSTSTTGVSQTDKEPQMNLSSVHDVIGMHGGRLFVKSAAGEDCTFWFTLPNIALGGGDKSHEQTFNLGR